MDEQERPNPDALLAKIQREESASARGKLRVFLGMCPGVGKTYAMLGAARERKAEGIHVVVGLVETHGRVETEALLAGLQIIPRKSLEYRGVTLSELDLDAGLALKPQLALVDELAHTNAPGSRHPKRFQDVVELLNAGIDVYSTLNVQHVESRTDLVHQITGVAVQETVPDSIVDLADEIELVDLTPEQLLERLRDGKVYLGDRAARAADHFFRLETLTALREIALRMTAEHVSRDLQEAVGTRGDAGPWKAGDRVMVAVGPSPSSEKLVRLARRTAGALNATWLAIYVDTGQIIEDAQRRQLASNLNLARTLGAEVISTAGTNLVETLLRVAREQAVTRIIVGKPLQVPRRQRWFGISLVDRLIRASGEIEIHLVQPELPGPHPSSPPWPAAAPWNEWIWALAILGSVTAVGTVAESVLGYQSVPLIYLGVLIVASLFLSRGPVMLLGVGSALAWNFFYAPPRFTLIIESTADALMFVLFFVVALVSGQLTARLRMRERAGIEGERRAQALYTVSRELAESREFETGLHRALAEIERVFHARSCLLRPDPSGDSLVQHPIGDLELSDKEKAVATWAWLNRRWAGRQTDTLPYAEATYVPLLVGEKAWGVLAIQLPAAETLNPLQRDLMESFAALLATMLEKEDAVRRAQEARISMESQKMQRALLDNFSHEMKTPLSVLAGALQRLGRQAQSPADQNLIGEASNAVSRLGFVVGQMVDLTQLDGGLIQPTWEWCETADFIREWANAKPQGEGRPPLNLSLPEKPVYIRVDTYLLNTALDNVLNNAVRHAPARTAVDISAIVKNKRVLIQVEDRGVGIREGEFEKIFERFYRGAGEPSGGLGLGLAITRQFTELLGGTIAAAPRPGGGATFTIALPCTADLPTPDRT